MIRAALAVALAAAPGLARAATYYVAPTGSDAGAGDRDHPWATLQRAAAVADAGDTVFVRGGVYPVSRPVRPAHSGRAGAPVVFRADPADPAVIDADALTQSDRAGQRIPEVGAFHVEGVSYVRIEHLGVRNAHTVGFMIRGAATHHVDLVGCTTHLTYGSGVGVWYARDVRVLGCEVVGANDIDMRPPGTPRPHEAPHEAISVAGAERFEVAYNHVHHGWKEGIDVKEVSAHGIVHHNDVHTMGNQGLYVDAWFGRLEDVEVYANLAHDCEWGVAVSAEGRGAELRDVRVHHNVLHDNRGSGVFFSVWGVDGPRSGVLVYNNTIYRNGTPRHWAGAVGGIDVRSANLRDVWIVNNVAFGNYAYDIATFDSTPGLTLLAARGVRVARNLSGAAPAAGAAGARQAGLYRPVFGTPGDSAVVGDPRLVRPPYDFRPRAGSPVVGAGLRDPRLRDAATLGAVQQVADGP